MISNRNLQNVMIKGTKEGLTLHLDGSSSFQDIYKELQEKLSANLKTQKDEPQIKVNIHTGNRIFSDEEKKQLIETIQSNQNLVVDKIYSDVILRDEAKRLISEKEMKTVVGMIRSGQVLETQGDILVIGDINPGAVVNAEGSIYIMGNVRGNVHAGCTGNRETVVAASIFTAGRISIANIHTTVAASSDDEDPLKLQGAYLNDQDEIIFDRLQALKQLRPNLTRLEGGL